MRSLRKSFKPQRAQMSEEKHKGQWNRGMWQEVEVVLRDRGGEVTKDWLLKSQVHHAGVKCVSFSVMSDSLWLHGLYLTRFLRPWNSPGKNTWW